MLNRRLSPSVRENIHCGRLAVPPQNYNPSHLCFRIWVSGLMNSLYIWTWTEHRRFHLTPVSSISSGKLLVASMFSPKCSFFSFPPLSLLFFLQNQTTTLWQIQCHLLLAIIFLIESNYFTKPTNNGLCICIHSVSLSVTGDLSLLVWRFIYADTKHTCWHLAGVFAGCASPSFWPRCKQHVVMQQSAFII